MAKDHMRVLNRSASATSCLRQRKAPRPIGDSNYGTVPEALLPFKINTTMYTGSENTFYVTAATRKIAAYFNLQRNLANWRSWLAQHGPILVGLNVDATWDNATATGGKLDTFQSNTVRGGHAVAVVGYTTDKRFILRKSWGTAWGDKGFGYASEAYINGGLPAHGTG